MENFMNAASNVEKNILTFRQFVSERHVETAARQKMSVTQVRSEMPDFIYQNKWRDEVVKQFNNGAIISKRLWRTLDEGLRYRLMRSTRALRDDALTHEMLNW